MDSDDAQRRAWLGRYWCVDRPGLDAGAERLGADELSSAFRFSKV